MDFGRWERVPWNDIDRTELDAWAADFFHARPHGGESVAMVSERVGSALADYRRSGVSHAVVTHAGIIKAARAAAGSRGRMGDIGGFRRRGAHRVSRPSRNVSPSRPGEVKSWD